MLIILSIHVFTINFVNSEMKNDKQNNQGNSLHFGIVDTSVSEPMLSRNSEPYESNTLREIKSDRAIEERYSAVPVKVVNEEEFKEVASIEPVFKIEQTVTVTETSDVDTTLSEFTSDSDVSYVNCYDVEKAQVYKKPSDDNAKPNGLSYKQTNDDIILDIITRQIIDENHNSKYIDKESKLEISILNKDVGKNEGPEKLKQESKVNIVEMKLKHEHPVRNISSGNNNNEQDHKRNVNEILLSGSEEEIGTCKVETSSVSNNNIQEFKLEIEQDESGTAINNEHAIPRYQKVTVTKEIRIPHKGNVGRKIDISLAQTRAKKSNQIDNKESNGSTTPVVLSKKSDNTIIKKIYADPLVRTFAKQSRENLNAIFSEEKVNGAGGKKNNERHRTNSVLSADVLSDRYIHSPNFKEHLQRSMSQTALEDVTCTMNQHIRRSTSLAYADDSDAASDYQAFSLGSFNSERTDISKQSAVINDPEIIELKEKHLVRSRLGEISKSFPNVSNSKVIPVKVPKKDNEERSTSSSFEILETNVKSAEPSTSVKNLKKMFEHADATSMKDRPIYSLTARSLSKQVRDNLKNQNLDEPLSIEVVKREPETAALDPSLQEEIEQPILNTENKIKFYEKLNE